MSEQPVPRVSREDVERVVRRDFPPSQHAEVLRILDGYQSNEPHRVHLAVLKLADSDLRKVRQWVDEANEDFRDVIVPAEYPEYARKVRSLDTPDDVRRETIQRDWAQYEAWLRR